MLKKILIGILIVLILMSSAAYYGYKKIEAQFESFIIAEVERRRAETEAILEKKIEEQTKEIVSEATQEIKDDIIIADNIITDVTETAIDSTMVVMEQDTEPLGATEVSEEQSSNEVTNNTQTTKPVNSSTPSKNQTNVSETAEETSEQTEVAVSEDIETTYTKADFERDKKIAMDLALSRLTAHQISRLIDISSGGFSPEEKKEAKEMFYSNFTAEEQEWILDIYTKYYYLVSEE